MDVYEYSSGQQQNESKNQLGKQCDMLLSNIDVKQQRNRQWVSKCYRHLNQLITQSSKTKFNLSNNCKQLPEIAMKYAFSIKPYEFDQSLQTFTKQIEESYAGKRKCQLPMVYKSSNTQWQALQIINGSIIIRQNNRFSLRIQAEENSTIIITHENNQPLRVKPDYHHTYFQKALLDIIPPSTICVVVIKEQSYTIDGPNGEVRTQTVPFKLPSNPVKIQIKRSNNKDGNANYLIRGLGDQNHMVRPQETFDHGLSSSQGSYIYPFIGIDTQSRSRD